MANPYALGQLAQALTTADEHEDAATRERADARVRAWSRVLDGMRSGALEIGSRTPVRGLPAWATPEVVRGGFATGRADSTTKTLRTDQGRVASQPSHVQLADIAARRLDPLPRDDGIVDIDRAIGPVTEREETTDVPRSTRLPQTVTRKVELGRAAPIEDLVREGVVPSSEVLAELIPPLTAQQVAASFADPALGALMGSTYTAFRRRRTLLLLNLAKQVQFTELPWVRLAFEVPGDAGRPDATAAVARRVAALALDAYPGTILPNPLISELTTLYAASGIDIPLTEELAADIFIGRFGPKFVRAARVAAQLLRGSLYERYYGLDVEEVLGLPEKPPRKNRLAGRFVRGSAQDAPETFESVCARGVPKGDRWSVARNGMIIERAQILTTHNLAALVGVGGARPTTSWKDLAVGAARVTDRLLARAQTQPRPLATVKDAAYAWRQAVFFLTMSDPGTHQQTIEMMRGLPGAAGPPMSVVIDGLEAAIAGPTQRSPGGLGSGAGMPFLGWSVGPHWAVSHPREPHEPT